MISNKGTSAFVGVAVPLFRPTRKIMKSQPGRTLSKPGKSRIVNKSQVLGKCDAMPTFQPAGVSHNRLTLSGLWAL
jgi:hypothetical protein